jgi:hypothetical protein
MITAASDPRPVRRIERCDPITVSLAVRRVPAVVAASP